jgi:hypothetical protein
VRERGGGEGEGREGGREREEHRQESKEGRIGERSTRKEDPPCGCSIRTSVCVWVWVLNVGVGACVLAHSLLSPFLPPLPSSSHLPACFASYPY